MAVDLVVVRVDRADRLLPPHGRRSPGRRAHRLPRRAPCLREPTKKSLACHTAPPEPFGSVLRVGNARTAVKTTAAAVDVVFRPPPGLVVLIYHRVGRRSTVEVDLPVEMFADQMRYLTEQHRSSRCPTGSPGWPNRARRTNRWWRSRSTTAPPTSPTSRSRCWPSTRCPSRCTWPPTSSNGACRSPTTACRCTWAALRDTRRAGWSTSDRTRTRHALLDRLDADAVAGELDRSIELIGEHVGRGAATLRVPEGGRRFTRRRSRGAGALRVGRDRGHTREPLRPHRPAPARRARRSS